MLSDILGRHHGPYLFMVYRTDYTKLGTTEVLPGYVDTGDVGEEAFALITDPRDDIEYVCVWSVPEEMFVTVIRTEKDL